MSLQDVVNRSNLLQRQLENLRETPNIQDCPYYSSLEECLGRVNEIIGDAQKPARIGLVGGFSAGKTRALESLLGLAGQLPVSESPSTGNIVEFRMFRDETTTESSLENWRVEMMDADALKGIRDELLTEAKALAVRENAAWLNSLENTGDIWGSAWNFAKEVHPKAQANKLKSVCFELYRLVYVHNGGTSYFGKEYSISLDQAKKLMTLDYDPKDVGKPLEQFDFSLASLNDDMDISRFSPESLSKFFGLVKKIKVDVRSAPIPFDRFAAAGMQEFLFVDCPGYGADTSSIRDQALCTVELENIDCILVLLNARTPGGSREYVDSARRFWGKEVNERLVVTVSRFDELPLNDTAGGQIRVELADDVMLTEQKVLTTFSGTLKTLMEQAETTAISENHENICLFSAMAYIDAAAAQELPLYLGPSSFLDKTIRSATDFSEHGWRTERHHWGAVGKRLLDRAENSGHPSSLGTLLTEFGYDGGGRRLIAMLCRHVEAHGAKNKESRLIPRLNRVETRFRKEIEPLFCDWVAKKEEYALEPVVFGDSKPLSLKEVRDQLDTLNANLNQYHNAFKGSTEFGFSLIFRPRGRTETVRIVPALKKILIDRICSWSEWDALFRYVDDEGLVKLVDEQTASDRRIPLKSDAFFDSFLEVLRGIQINFRDFAAPVIQFNFDILGEMLNAKGLLKGGTVLDTEKLCQALQHKTVRQELQKKALFTSAWCKAPTWDQISLLFSGLERNTNIPLIYDDNEPDNFYPLQRGIEKGGTGTARTFPWLRSHYEEYERHFTKENRHFVNILQIRQVLVDAAIYFLDATAGALEKELRKAIDERLSQLKLVLQDTIRVIIKEGSGLIDNASSTGGGLATDEDMF